MLRELHPVDSKRLTSSDTIISDTIVGSTTVIIPPPAKAPEPAGNPLNGLKTPALPERSDQFHWLFKKYAPAMHLPAVPGHESIGIVARAGLGSANYALRQTLCECFMRFRVRN